MSITNEVSQQMSYDQAQNLTRKIHVALEGTHLLIIEAHKGQAHKALNYQSWADYVSQEFGHLGIQIDRSARDETILAMREAGMSTRAIGTSIGMSRQTVQRTIEEHRDEIDPSIIVQATNGGLYQQRQPQKPEELRAALDDEFDESMLDGLDGESLNIEVKTARPAPARIVEKPKKIRLEPVTKDGQRGASDAVIRVAETAKVALAVQEDLFAVDDLEEASKATLLAASLVQKIKVDPTEISSETRTAICSDLQQVVDQLNQVLDELVSQA